MATTMATTMTAVLNARATKTTMKSPPSMAKPITSLLSLPTLPKGLTSSSASPLTATTISASALAGAFFSAMSVTEPAMAAQQIAELAAANAADDNRGLALLLPIIPALAWVLYNILQPALNQLNKMRSEKALIVGLGLGSLTASGFWLVAPPEAQAAGEELGMVAAAVANGGDNRGQLLLLVLLPAIGWVLYNILQPALNQLNKMRSQ